MGPELSQHLVPPASTPEMSKLKPRCRLYLQVAAPFLAKKTAQLSQALSELGPACVLISGNNEPLETGVLDSLIDRIQGAGAACLIENSIEASVELGADGVHIAADKSLYSEARNVLGESANIGVACGLVRHDAMELAELGANYVAFTSSGSEDAAAEFDALSETIAWWSEIFVVPCVAWDIAEVARAAALTELGVDFIAPPSTVWEREDALTFLRDMDRTIGSIRRET